MQPAPISRLPQELVDQIIDTLVSDGFWFRTLLSCGLAWRAFLPRSRSYLFHNIKFSFGEWDFEIEKRKKRFSQLLNILQENPRIADYVLEMEVELSERQVHCITHDKTFIHIMRLLKRSHQPIQKLILRRKAGFRPRLPKRDFVDHFFRPFFADTIASLEFHFISDIPIVMFECCLQLNEIKLFDAELEKVRLHARRRATHVRARLASVEVSDARPLLMRLSNPRSNGLPSPVDFTFLREFVIHTVRLPDLLIEQEIVDIAGGSLEVLKIEDISDQHDSTFTGYMNLQKAYHLRVLNALAIFRHQEREESPLRAFHSMLSTIPSENCIETLEVVCQLGYYGSAMPDDLLDPMWTQVQLELLRVLGDRPSIFTVSMIYRDPDPRAYSRNRKISDKRSAEANELCSATLERLKEQYFAAWSQSCTHTFVAKALVDNFG